MKVRVCVGGGGGSRLGCGGAVCHTRRKLAASPRARQACNSPLLDKRVPRVPRVPRAPRVPPVERVPRVPRVPPAFEPEAVFRPNVRPEDETFVPGWEEMEVAEVGAPDVSPELPLRTVWSPPPPLTVSSRSSVESGDALGDVPGESSFGVRQRRARSGSFSLRYFSSLLWSSACVGHEMR